VEDNGVEYKIDMKILELRETKYFRASMSSSELMFHSEITYSLSPKGSGTTLNHTNISTYSAFYMKPITPLITFLVQRKTNLDFFELKKLCERKWKIE